MSNFDDRTRNASQTPLVRCLLLVGGRWAARGRVVAQLARTAGVAIDAFRTRRSALEALTRQSYRALLVDLSPGHGGARLLDDLRRRGLRLPLIGLAPPEDISLAVQAMRLGACDVLPMPVEPRQLRLAVHRILEDPPPPVGPTWRPAGPNLLGKSPAMIAVFDLADRVARSGVTVLLEGETGTGKEQVAQAIHAASDRRTRPLVVVNCLAVPQTLLESELFGHEKGAFTGAIGQRRGRLEQADGGTLFLDEVGDVPPAVQGKLLRVLQERRFERIGGTETVEVDVRILASSNRPLVQLVREGKFREDLYYRLNVIRLEVPPLRERPEDIPLLAAHFAARYAPPGGPPRTFTADALDVLADHHWPGNVRELENVVQRVCVTGTRGPIGRADLPPELLERPTGTFRFQIDLRRPLPEMLRELVANFEQQFLRRALRRSHGRIGRCAEICGLSRRSVTLDLLHNR